MYAVRLILIVAALLVAGLWAFRTDHPAVSIVSPPALAPGAVVAGQNNAPEKIRPDALLHAVQVRDRSLVERLLADGANVESADAEGVTPLMLAAINGDVELLQLLVQHSARLDATDFAGRTAAHHAVLAREPAALAFLLERAPQLATPVADGPDLVAMACGAETPAIVRAVLEHQPDNLAWTPATRRALRFALKSGDAELSRLLLRKHSGPPTVEGSSTPLLAQAIATDESEIFNQLLAAGADPNTVLPVPPEKSFLAQLKSDNLRGYAREDQGVTMLMIAAGLGRTEYIRALLAAGADRNRQTARYKMLALYFAARSGKVASIQTLLGRGPSPDELRVEISLATQRASVIKNGVPILETTISTGRKGFATPAGEFVITDKDRDHRSTIYKVPMPYFMRLSCLDFGMHAGVVPNYPASHGCIRLPANVAQKLFSEIPVGTLVTIN